MVGGKYWCTQRRLHNRLAIAVLGAKAYKFFYYLFSKTFICQLRRPLHAYVHTYVHTYIQLCMYACMYLIHASKCLFAYSHLIAYAYDYYIACTGFITQQAFGRLFLENPTLLSVFRVFFNDHELT